MDSELATRLELPTTPDYGFGVRIPGATVEQARQQVIDALAAEGFGVVTELDVRAALAGKLGVDIGPYLILGACNPRLAQRALAIEPYVGLFLPCNVALWRGDGETIVTCANPDALVRLTGDNRLLPIADETERLLRLALARLV